MPTGAAVPGLRPKKKMEPKKRLKQLHWIKINERKVASTIWEKMRDEDLDIEFEVIEDLFAAKVVAKVPTAANGDGEEEAADPAGGPRKKRVVILLSANRSQTIGVLLSHLKMPHEDFRRAITSLDTRTLQPNFVIQLMKLLPTDQEVAALQSYTGPKEELGTAERFLFELLCIPRLKPRLQCFVFILEFNARLHDLSENVEVFSYAIHDIKRCTKLIKVIELVLAIGNYLNGTGAKGGAYGFKLEFLTKLADTKTADNKSTLLHYLVAMIERKYADLLDFPQELSNVEIGAKVSENMVDEISKFKKEIKFIYEEMNRPYYKSNAKNDPCGAKLEQFYHTAYNDMEVLEQNKKEALSMYKEISKLYGEDELKPDEFMTAIHQFAQSFKEAHNENTRQREEEERIRRKREAFLKQMQDKEKLADARKKARAATTNPGANPGPNLGPTPKPVPGLPDRDRSVQNRPSPAQSMLKPGDAESGKSMQVPAGSAQHTPRSNIPVVSGGGSDSISDMINGMPKSGKFTIKKPNADASAPKNLVRDHLSAPKRNAANEDLEFDDIPTNIPSASSTPRQSSNVPSSRAPTITAAPTAVQKPPTAPGAPPPPPAPGRAPPPAAPPAPGMRPPPMPQKSTGPSEGGDLRGNLKEFGKFLSSPTVKR